MRCENQRCRAALLIEIDRLGRTIARCPSCERRRAGRCVQCNAPRWSKRAWGKYCAACVKASDAKAVRKYQENNIEMLREKARVRMAKRRRLLRNGRPPMSNKERLALAQQKRREKLTPAQRTAIAKVAVKARWQKYYQRQMLRKMQEASQ